MIRLIAVLFALVVSSPVFSQALWNSADQGALVILSNGGLDASGSGNAFNVVRATNSQSTGKQCFELEFIAADGSASIVTGIANASASLSSYPGATSASAGVQWLATAVQPFVSGVSRSNAFTVASTSVVGDIITICVDFSLGSAWWGRNGAWTSGDPATGSTPNVTGISGAWFPAVGTYNSANKLRLRSLSADIQYLPNGFAGWADGVTPPPPPPPPPPSQLWTFPAVNPYPIFPPVWAKVGGAEIYKNTAQVRQPVGPGMISTCWNTGGGCTLHGPAFNTWMTVDLTLPPWNVPVDATWAILSGIGGISGGPANHAIIYRKPGDETVACIFVASTVNNIAVQFNSTIEGGQGTRQNATVQVPLANGRYEFCWWKSPVDQPGPTYFWNPSLVEWSRAGP